MLCNHQQGIKATALFVAPRQLDRVITGASTEVPLWVLKQGCLWSLDAHLERERPAALSQMVLSFWGYSHWQMALVWQW